MEGIAGFYKTPVGRVKTPTLAMVVRREDEINKLMSRPLTIENI